MSRGTGFVLVLVAMLAFDLAAAPESVQDTTAFRLSAYGGVVVDAVVDGKTFRLLVDTGSTHSVVTRQLADAVQAPLVALAPLTANGGESLVPVVRLDRLALGPIIATVQASVVQAMPIADEADGLMGQDVLGSKHYTIDYRRRVIEWHAPSADARKPTAIQLAENQGRFVATATLLGRRMPLVLDTAADRLVLFGPALRFPLTPRDAAGVALASLTGPVPIRIGVVDELRLGGVALRQIATAIVNRPWTTGQPEGLLPTHGFGRVTINGPARTLVVEGRQRSDVFLMTPANQ